MTVLFSNKDMFLFCLVLFIQPICINMFLVCFSDKEIEVFFHDYVINLSVSFPRLYIINTNLSRNVQEY